MIDGLVFEWPGERVRATLKATADAHAMRATELRSKLDEQRKSLQAMPKDSLVREEIEAEIDQTDNELGYQEWRIQTYATLAEYVMVGEKYRLTVDDLHTIGALREISLGRGYVPTRYGRGRRL